QGEKARQTILGLARFPVTDTAGAAATARVRLTIAYAMAEALLALDDRLDAVRSIRGVLDEEGLVQQALRQDGAGEIQRLERLLPDVRRALVAEAPRQAAAAVLELNAAGAGQQAALDLVLDVDQRSGLPQLNSKLAGALRSAAASPAALTEIRS